MAQNCNSFQILRKKWHCLKMSYTKINYTVGEDLNFCHLTWHSSFTYHMPHFIVGISVYLFRHHRKTRIANSKLTLLILLNLLCYIVQIKRFFIVHRIISYKTIHKFFLIWTHPNSYFPGFMLFIRSLSY